MDKASSISLGHDAVLMTIQTSTLRMSGEVSFHSILYPGNEKHDVGLSLVS